MNNFNSVDKLMFLLLAIGGLNWGLIGLLDFNLVEALTGGYNAISQLIYILVGISALYTLYRLVSPKEVTTVR